MQRSHQPQPKKKQTGSGALSPDDRGQGFLSFGLAGTTIQTQSRIWMGFLPFEAFPPDDRKQRARTTKHTQPFAWLCYILKHTRHVNHNQNHSGLNQPAPMTGARGCCHLAWWEQTTNHNQTSVWHSTFGSLPAKRITQTQALIVSWREG